MDEATKFSEDSLQALLSIPDPLPAGVLRRELLAPLTAAPSASLFVLSRRAQSAVVRGEAAKALEASLHKGNTVTSATSADADAVARGELPAEVATVRHFYKFAEGEHWVLTTRSGVHISTFKSEADLDHWWRGLRKQRGRILTRIRKAVS